jgi:hypothetical protein
MQQPPKANDPRTLPPGLAAALRYPLLSAIRERRTRRVCCGTSILAGGLSHESTNKPIPLSPLEEAILIVSTGLTGLPAMHDVPLEKPEGGQELGTPLVNILSRSASSPDNCQATSFFMLNEEGTWLIKQPKGDEAAALLRNLPPRWEDWREEDWISTAKAVKVRIFERRLDFPRQWPYYLGWNKQLSNLQGTTIFLPLVDCTRQMINVLLIVLSEPDGQRPLFIDDWQKFRPKTFVDVVAWLGSLVGLVPDIAYQPIGGIRRVRSGFVNPEHIAPLGLASTMRTDYEALFLLQNLMLVSQALGLGGWIHAAVPAPYIFQRDPEKQLFGLGFRVAETKKRWRRSPPLPSTQPNPVGADGILEGLCPPYVKSMNEAVDRVIEEKFGKQGVYQPEGLFSRPYRHAGSASEFLRVALPHSKDAIQYAKDICNYILDTYGRFPAHVNAFHVPGVWLQIHHVETEYYDRFFDPSLYHWQAEHQRVWGKH